MQTLLVTLVVLSLAGCGSPDAGGPPAPAAPSPPGLPSTAPGPDAASIPCAHLPQLVRGATRVRLTEHDYERPEAMRRWDVVAEDDPCPPDELPAHLGYARPRCVAVPAAELDALYRVLRPVLARLRTHAVPPTPHRGGHTVDVAWSGGSCSISAVSGEHEIARDDAAAFGAAVDAIGAVVRAHTR